MYGVFDRHVPAPFLASLFSMVPVSVTSSKTTQKGIIGEGDGTKKSFDTMACKHTVGNTAYVTTNINGF